MGKVKWFWNGLYWQSTVTLRLLISFIAKTQTSEYTCKKKTKSSGNNRRFPTYMFDNYIFIYDLSSISSLLASVSLEYSFLP